ncbi:GNAT family N-acetyltransferase (plasmid) [Macrococcus psychrotolerans]|uniref:GNAT family N-acetyltransferase n=1 Tax=Macrococcus psychrotolerans TaxID=3039389 RepID=A0AAT9PA05_9STAP|nr:MULTISPECIES: GNAT family N-acetyltransferase [Macrococcus]QYA34082.1 GNAT family N-acetyltransferase [Macrococcus sp. 19Msa1099]QYA38867.1 GNAT family N-acetyltransferase [Macrococcus caseolyticus]QYA77590.1 GNAT family N-acetyltransferase [Macrococcus caseolyticus]
MKIRQANIDDLETVSILFNKYRIFYEKESDLKGAKNFIKNRIENEESIIFIAEYGEVIAGFVQIYPTFSSVSMKKSYILNDLFVDEKFRRNNLGESLINEVFKYAVSKDAKYVTLETSIGNINAQKLYEKMNMKIDNSVFHYIKKS